MDAERRSVGLSLPSLLLCVNFQASSVRGDVFFLRTFATGRCVQRTEKEEDRVRKDEESMKCKRISNRHV